VWSRVGCDLLDLAALGVALKTLRNDRAATAASLAAVAGINALDVTVARKVSAYTPEISASQRGGGRRFVNRHPEDCYRQWRNFQDLPRLMTYLQWVSEKSIEAGELEDFLTARFRLYSFIGETLTCTEVEHPRWPLEAARVIRLEQTLTDAAGISKPEGTACTLLDGHSGPRLATQVVWAPNRTDWVQ
jgi:hypothetical protein